MPPRFVVCLIVAFWLASIGWLAYREWLPWLQADAAPRPVVELADEAAPSTANWSIWRAKPSEPGEHKIGHATTRMICLKDDTLELQSSIKQLEIEQNALAFKVLFRVPDLVTTQHVTREGQLLSVESRMVFQVTIPKPKQEFEFTVRLSGQVKDGKLHSHCEMDALGMKSREQLEPADLPSGSILNPLQPLARMNVRPGQSWKIAGVNPLDEALTTSVQRKIGLKLPVSPPKVILAKVLSEPKELIYHEKSVSCYVIEYHSDDFSGSTWVQAEDGKVLRQEAVHLGDRIVLRRED